MAFPAAAPCAPKPRCAPAAAAAASWELRAGEPGHSPGTGGTSGNASPDKCLQFPSSSGDKLAHASIPQAECARGVSPSRLQSTRASRVPQAVQHGEIPMFSRCRGGNLKETPVPSLPWTQQSHSGQITDLVLVLTESPGKFGKNPHCD